MGKIPAAVLKKLEEIKASHKYTVSLSTIKGKFYALETVKKFVKTKNKYVTFTHYLGRILDDGVFVEAKHRKVETNTTSLDGLIKMKMDQLEKADNNYEVSETELKILTSLSTDARRPVADLARELNMSTTNVEYHIKKLENKYDICYILELPIIMAFRLSRFVITIKFIDKRPDWGAVKAALLDEVFVQLVLVTKGDYDLFVIVLVEGTVELGKLLYKIRNKEAFSKYNSFWNVSPLSIDRASGYNIPLRGEFFDFLKQRVWHKSEETPVRLPDQLLEREYIVLKELYNDSVIDFAEIDKKYNLSAGATQYTYHKLIERGIILRSTITMNNPPLRYVAILHLDQLNMHQFSETREELFLNRISSIKSPLNKYVLSGDFTMPDGIINIAPIVEPDGLSTLENSLKEKIKGIVIKSLIVTDLLIGNMDFRRLDYHETNAYKILREEYRYTEEEIRRKVELNIT